MKLIGWVAAALVFAANPLAAQETEVPQAEPAVEPLTGDAIDAALGGDAPQPTDATFTPDAETLDFTSTRYADLRIDDAAAPIEVPTKDFAGRSSFRDFEMSPDGSKLLFVRKVDDVAEIVILDVATEKVMKRMRLAEKQEVDWVRWAGNQKLLVSVSFPGFYNEIPIRINRLFGRDLATDEYWILKVDRKVFWGGDLVHIAEDGSYALISVQRTRADYPSVYRYELKPEGEIQRIVKPKQGVWSWYADTSGNVRLGMGWYHKRLRVYYRGDAAGKFKLVGKLKADGDESRYWSVVQIVSGSDKGYVLEEGENGRVGVRLFDYSTGEVVETYYENADWDVERLWLNRDGTPRAALYTDDRERIVWFDEEDKKRYNLLKKALKQEELHYVARSRDNERALVWAGNEADPGALYIFTPDEKSLKLFANYRPDLDFTQLVKPQPIKYKARDGLEISSYLTLPRGRPAKNLPLIIMPHGGPYGVRDSLSYNDEVQVLANRGYAVLQPNYRGSGGYGEAFYDAGNGEIGRKMQDDLDDAMDWAVNEGIADPSRVCVVGGSYGGYASLWAVLRNPERYRCAASWAGVTDFNRMLRYDRKFLKRKAAREWRQQVEGEDDFDLDMVSPTSFAARLSRPVLLAHGTSDRNVPFSQYKRFEKASRKAPVKPTTLVIEDEGHSFSKAESEKAWYDALVKFLAEHNPADPVEVGRNSADAAVSDGADATSQSQAGS